MDNLTIILGSSGLLGSHICNEYRKYDAPYLPLKHADLDITDIEQSRELLEKHAPAQVINCAAFCSFQGCEDNPELSRQVNLEAPCWWAQECSRRGIKMVHFSSDYIFDGTTQIPYTEDSEPAPESVYANHKAGCEEFFRQFPEHLILRVSWLFGQGGKTFLSMMPKLLMENSEMTVAAGKRGTCLHVGYAATVIRNLLDSGECGLFNLVHTGVMSWEEFAKSCLDELKLRGLIPACQSIKEVPYDTLLADSSAKRPEYSALDTTKLSRALDRPVMPWRDGLGAYLDAQFPASTPVDTV